MCKHQNHSDLKSPLDFPLPSKLKGGRLSELLERIPYLSSDITGVAYDSAAHLARISFEGCGSKLNNQLAELVQALFQSRIAPQREERSNSGSGANVSADHAFDPAAVYRREGIEALQGLDQLLAQMAAQHTAAPRDYPTIYQAQTMESCGYHKNFPQNVFGVTRIPHDYSMIKQIRESTTSRIADDMFVSDGAFLQPCVCYHCYEEWRNEQIENAVLTARGRCFRHEIQWKLDDFRRNEFTMREIAFVGTEEWVETRRQSLMNDTWDLFCDLGLGGHIVTARDPFFHYDDMMTKGAVQLMADAKFELEFISSEGVSSSIASFNNCGHSLTEKFSISGPDGAADRHSGCVAFGLDRWRAALFTRFGTDKAQWPVQLRNAIQ